MAAEEIGAALIDDEGARQGEAPSLVEEKEQALPLGGEDYFDAVADGVVSGAAGGIRGVRAEICVEKSVSGLRSAFAGIHAEIYPDDRVKAVGDSSGVPSCHKLGKRGGYLEMTISHVANFAYGAGGRKEKVSEALA